MTWFKVDDGFLTHPKVYGIKSGPLALWLRAGCWCAGELTDGRVPARALRGLEAKPAYVKELVDRGLWEPAADGFQFHDWLDYQPSRDQVLKTRNETLQRVRKHRNAVTNAIVTPAPVPVPVPVPEPKENQEREARARESSARFEKPPVGEAPPELPKPAANPPSWLRVWQLFAEHRGLDPVQLGHPGRQQEALQSIAGAAEVEAGGRQGEGFDRAVQRLLGAWSADKWVKEKQPTLANLAANLHRYARAMAKPPVKLVGAPMKPEDCCSDEDLLAWPDWKEGDLTIWQKQRRWTLQNRAARKAGAAE